MTEDFKEGYLAAVAHIRLEAKFLRLNELDDLTRDQKYDCYYVLIKSLLDHLKFNEELENV